MWGKLCQKWLNVLKQLSIRKKDKLQKNNQDHDMLKQIYKLLARITYLRRQLILKKARAYKNIDFTPQDEVPDMVACVHAVTTLLKELGLVDKIYIGTYTFGQKLLRRQIKGWEITDKPQPGDIAIAMTGTGIKTPHERKYGDVRGHIFIVDEDGWWSNDSYDGKWKKNYTEKTAKYRYEILGGMDIYYFRYFSLL